MRSWTKTKTRHICRDQKQQKKITRTKIKRDIFAGTKTIFEPIFYACVSVAEFVAMSDIMCRGGGSTSYSSFLCTAHNVCECESSH